MFECEHPLFVITSCCISENCQTIYCDRKFFMIKVCSYKLLMTVFVYNYAILRYIVNIILDLKRDLFNCYVWR